MSKLTDAPNFFIGRSEAIAQNDKLSNKARQSLYTARAANTVDAYRSDWNDFCDWCSYHQLSSFPAEPETIVNYINDLADNAKANTIARRISALTENFDAAGYKENPCRYPIDKTALRGIQRMKATLPHRKAPIHMHDINEMLTYLEGDEIQQVRDKAILLVGFYGALRRSELAGIDVEDLKFTRLGLLITLRKSKTDQFDQGQMIAIPMVKDKEYCAVTALQKWLDISGITTGPVFRGLTKGHHVRKTRISDKSIALIVKHYAGLMGMNPDDYGAHSLRHGFATSAAQHHVEERQIMRQTRHKSQAIVRRYIDEADRLIDNPILKITEDSH